MLKLKGRILFGILFHRIWSVSRPDIKNLHENIFDSSRTVFDRQTGMCLTAVHAIERHIICVEAQENRKRETLI